MAESVGLELGLEEGGILAVDMDEVAPLTEEEWSDLLMALGPSEHSVEQQHQPPAHQHQHQDLDCCFFHPSSQASTTFLLPSSPESGSESSLQPSPQSSPYNDFLFTFPIPEEAQKGVSCLPPLSPKFFPAEESCDSGAPGLGNAGMAGQSLEASYQDRAAASFASGAGYGRHLGQPLARLQPAPTPSLADQDAASCAKKRRRNDLARDEATSGVILARETLLKLSSAEMEAYLHCLKATRQISPEEEKELKKQLRLIKNREYAQESRKKKKTAHQELEHELTGLRAQNCELRNQNSALQSEVVLLNSKLSAMTGENMKLRGALRKVQAHLKKKSGSSPVNQRTRLDEQESMSSSNPLSWFSLGSASVPPSKAAATAGGVCLLGFFIFALGFLLQGPSMLMGSSRAGDMAPWSPTARVILHQEETTTYSIRRSTWTAPPPQYVEPVLGSDEEPQPDDPHQSDEEVARCGYDNMCYLYADKSHHVKTAPWADFFRQQHQRQSIEVEEREDERLHNHTHHAIPIPTH